MARESSILVKPGTAGTDGGAPKQKHVLFDGGDSDSDMSDEEPPSAADLALAAALAEVERVPLDMRVLQALSTTKLTPEQAADASLDLLTGFHLVDGKERVVVLEGRREGAVKLLQVRRWGLQASRKPAASLRKCWQAPSLQTAPVTCTQCMHACSR